MKIRFLGRNIEIANRINVDGFKNEKILIGCSWRKKDLMSFKGMKRFLLFCIMPYKWLDKRFCKGKI